MTPLQQVQGRTAEPTAEELEQAFGAARKATRVELTHSVRLGQLVHQPVEPVDKSLDGGCATQAFVDAGGCGGAGRSAKRRHMV